MHADKKSVCSLAGQPPACAGSWGSSSPGAELYTCPPWTLLGFSLPSSQAHQGCTEDQHSLHVDHPLPPVLYHHQTRCGCIRSLHPGNGQTGWVRLYPVLISREYHWLQASTWILLCWSWSSELWHSASSCSISLDCQFSPCCFTVLWSNVLLVCLSEVLCYANFHCGTLHEGFANTKQGKNQHCVSLLIAEK